MIVQDAEDESVMRVKELQEEEGGNEMKSQSESNNTETSRNSPTSSQPEDGSTATQRLSTTQTSPSSSSLPACLPERTEQKRLSWMKDCVPWSKLSLQNRRKQEGGVHSGRGAGRRGRGTGAEARGLTPLCTHTLLQSTGCTSLQEVTLMNVRAIRFSYCMKMYFYFVMNHQKTSTVTCPSLSSP